MVVNSRQYTAEADSPEGEAAIPPSLAHAVLSMMSMRPADSSSDPDASLNLIVSAFADEAAARRAAEQVPGAQVLAPTSATEEHTNQPRIILEQLGLPGGVVTFYGQAADRGRWLVVAPNDGQGHVRRQLRQAGGIDASLRGGELARGDDDRTIAPERTPMRRQPPDVTRAWDDVRSRYEMLWAQRYGIRDLQWAQFEPAYRFIWEAAQQPRFQLQSWQEAAPVLQREWSERGGAPAWDIAALGMEDVWLDVADEARLLEGGAQRRVVKPFE